MFKRSGLFVKVKNHFERKFSGGLYKNETTHSSKLNELFQK